MRTGLGFALMLVLCGGILQGSAGAADWTQRQVGDSFLYGISCPSTSRCVAVGAGNTVLSSDNPTGGAQSWKAVNVGAGELGPYYSPARQIRDVECPAAGFCVAVSYEGFVYTSTDPTGGAGGWSVADLSPEGPNVHLYGISCPAIDLCVVAATGGKILTSTNPAGGAGAWAVAQLPSTLQLRDVSCPSAGLCVAVGDEGEIVNSTQPLAGAGSWRETQLPGASIDRFLQGVDCPTAGLCVTGNSVNTLFVTTSPTGPAGAWVPAQGKSTVQITDVECPSATRCVAIDNNGDVLTSTDPTGGAAAWTIQNLLPYPHVENETLNANGLFGVSCPSTGFCAIAASKGQVFTSTNPFEPPTAEAKPKPKKKHRKRKGPKRPRAIIALSPPPGVEAPHGKAKIRFRFFAARHASVRGFVCKLDQRRFKPCKSPKTYRVGYGKHVFKVRAVGWTGHRGKVAFDRWEVCKPTDGGAYCFEPPGRRGK